MRWKEIAETVVTEIEQMEGDWSNGIEDRCERYLEDAEPYATIGGFKVMKTVDRKITMLMFYDGPKLFGFAALTEDSVKPNAVEIEIAFAPEYQRRGLGLETYKFLLSKGYVIVSGYHQYPGAIAIWKKLMADPAVTVSVTYPRNPRAYDGPVTIRPVRSADEPWTTKNEYLRLIATPKGAKSRRRAS